MNSYCESKFSLFDNNVELTFCQILSLNTSRAQCSCHAFTFPFFTTRRADPAKNACEGVAVFKDR